MNVAFLCCATRLAREARDRDRVPIGFPLTEPLRTRAEGEAWVAIGVPLIEPRPRRKPSPWETPLIWVRREKISQRMKLLQDLVPGCNKMQPVAS
ncbi:hypothetical protein D1007_39386 [Hordeum vulgare]|nr:hypothetical protein D1007_39386 [Hordeum vulgare]